MKVINYHYGYFQAFSCSIHGKIIATREEWDRAVKYLLHPKVKGAYIHKDILKQDLKRVVSTKNGQLLNVRVGATEKIAKKFGLTIKRANYIFCIV